MNKRAYTPVSCDFMDQIERFAITQHSGSIRFRDALGIETQVEDRVKTWLAKDGVEYLITESQLKIRLDDIIELFGLYPGAKFC